MAVAMGVVMLAFLGSILYTFIAVGQAAGTPDKKNDLALVIYNITIVDSLLIVAIGITAFFYFQEDTPAYDAYVMFMLHVALFTSIMSSSISALHQLNAPTATPATPPATKA